MLWSDERIQNEIDAIEDERFTGGATWTIKSLVKGMREDYEARIAELEMMVENYDETVKEAPTIISGLELENWKLKARIAELEEKYGAACDRNQELEAELAKTNMWQDYPVIHPEEAAQ